MFNQSVSCKKKASMNRSERPSRLFRLASSKKNQKAPKQHTRSLQCSNTWTTLLAKGNRPEELCEVFIRNGSEDFLYILERYEIAHDRGSHQNCDDSMKTIENISQSFFKVSFLRSESRTPSVLIAARTFTPKVQVQ